MSYQSGQTSITGSVTVSSTTQVPVLGSTQTMINVAHAGNGTVQTIYTVTSGKTLYVFGVQAGYGYQFALYKSDGTTQICNHATGASVDMFASVGGSPIAVYTTGTAVKANVSNGSTGFLIGVEQ